MSRVRFPTGRFALLLGLDTLVFVLQKVASTRAVGQGGVFYLALLQQPLLWITLALGLAQLYCWTRILRAAELSLAYPLTSLGYPVTMLVAQLFLAERLPWPVWLGALLITAGTILVGSTSVTGEAAPAAAPGPPPPPPGSTGSATPGPLP